MKASTRATNRRRSHRTHEGGSEVKVRINTIIQGDPAEWLLEWKRRGLVSNYTDAVIQALRAFHEKVNEQDLKTTQLQNLRENENWE